MDFTHSSRKSWSLLRKLGGAPQHEQKTPKIQPDDIAKRMQSITKAAATDKVFAKKIRQCNINLNSLEEIDEFSQPFTMRELAASLGQTKANKAAGPDEIYPEFLLHLGKIGKRWLLDFFNNILESARLPDVFKRSKVIAILKPGKSPDEASSYRPISLLSVSFKLLERLLYNRIYRAANSAIPPEQAGFREGRSCADQVLALSSYIEAGFQKGLKTFVAFVDLSAAYDTVWIDGLLHKFAKIFPCRKTIQLMRSILGPRHVRVHLGEKFSRFRLLKNGLPQGSVLAPLLFNIYTSDIPQTSSRQFAYADDLALAFQAKSFEEGEAALTTDLKSIGDYYSKWRLCPNPSKTEVAAFHLTNCLADQKLQVSFCGQTVEQKKSPKYLGVTLDRSLTFRQHLENVAQKIKSRLNILKSLAGTSWGASASVLRTTALALVYSTAEYCAPVWYRSAHTGKVDTQLNEAMRLVAGLIRPTPLPWLPVLAHIPPPDLRRCKAAAFEWKKCFRPGMPIRSTLETLPPHRLPSRSPIWTDNRLKTDFSLKSAWQSSWDAFSDPQKDLINNPTSKPAGFNSDRQVWVRLNRFRTGYGCSNHHLFKWGLKESPACECGAEDQTLSHIVNDCRLHSFPGGLRELNLLTPAAENWLRQLTINI